ncbi:MAG TPA: glycerophosphodiester phosphodiesterase family protein [Xanthobacteraceae bacterium]|jgi:glycerophosphoryl diester phosphodiesterase|nr:glycerophosphodiester phosphodiesterase family protein [Xanthobacteraceae bacterium]
MGTLDWLTARPVAHRGLHDAARGVIENTPSAFDAAIAGNYGIETDVQLSRDGEAMVYHDDALGRLTDGSGRLADLTVTELRTVPFRSTADRMITLAELTARVAGRVALVVEIKSRFDGEERLATRVAQVLGDYPGRAAAMSFDPDVVARLRRLAPQLTRGIVAERHYGGPKEHSLTAEQSFDLGILAHASQTRPDFVAYRVDDLPVPATHMSGQPVLTWTVRTPGQRERAREYAQQMIFEGFRP